MMQIRIVRVFVKHRHMPMPMRMGLARRIFRSVLMLVMRVVSMTMFVLHGLVNMFVCMQFTEVKVEANRHQQSCNQQRHRQRLVKQHQ